MSNPSLMPWWRPGVYGVASVRSYVQLSLWVASNAESRGGAGMNRFRQAFVVVVITLAGCAQTTVQTEQETFMTNLPPPGVVLVHKIGVNLQEVTATQGLFGMAIDAVEQQTQNEQAAQLAQEVSNDFTDELVKQINDLGLQAQRATGTY